MSKFGILKTKILNKLTESYSTKNKKEVKDILSTIKENKEFKEMYLFYEEIENKYIEDKEVAQLYVENISPILRQNMENIKEFSKSLDAKMDVTDVKVHELYEALDALTESDKLSNVENKVTAKRKLIEHLTTKKEIVENAGKNVTPNENLLNAVLANNFNVLYNATLSESEKEKLKEILSIPQAELVTNTTELKESILTQVDGLLKEATDELATKLTNVQKEVKEMEPSKYNYYRLQELKNGLN
jgi:uncharacterized protein (DUF1015 family)